MTDKNPTKRIEKLTLVVEAIEAYRVRHQTPAFGSDLIMRAMIEIENAKRGAQGRERHPITFGEKSVRKALAEMGEK